MRAQSKNRNPETVKKFQAKLVSRMMRANPPFLSECEFRPVRSAAEFKLAAHLVYLEYRRKKYSLPNKGQIRLTIHQAVKKSTTLIALYKKKYVIGTMTVIDDSALGLPMDKIYNHELNRLRSRRKKLVECGMLAMNDRILGDEGLNFSQNDRMTIVLHLIKSMVHFLRNNTDRNMLVCCFHPKHEFFYKGIQLEPFAGLKEYQSVQGSPAVAYYWDLAKMEATASSHLQTFFGFGMPKTKKIRPERRARLKIDEFGVMFLSSSE